MAEFKLRFSHEPFVTSAPTSGTAATSGAIDTKSTSTGVYVFVFSTGVFDISVIEDLDVSVVPVCGIRKRRLECRWLW
ncbi:hypothetical protein L2E82_15606 [Cichorium intybus]|uniref:Uncharacterized protein n=1 Tax=Cichorium intybus TaxID=13427 RepID=A0ACB9F3U0_CICIN|nr:hypothetical protein L2E82_15606 [Cichorium intybus]